ncbi:NAD(P)/FAD-dependent oxidoreductase [Lysinibacillus xylanilyticus]|uniref:NAD(P)/FAD-dependent oxidoreductase n=1 Tax=Lysinibacillus xylanilyticus TaxID=582475 RepID=A0ABT4EV52_9BACI|nr:FAD/NAD(P)-binding oxidoreductase [Lysinibacillus xylanilyticus]MCY9548146.1 NAD(P)/FAD-dependent oxidoreductase [Lysinibacillus xylanilyticus]MED3804297.1 FAD/NAD(P)-binding oxidoreductase [Lysinibacillus xylanilyticus]
MKTSFKVVIVGGGTAGISVAARLLRQSHSLQGEVAIIDPAEKHYYQPLWTLVGGGAANKWDSEREMLSVIPEGAVWLKEAVSSFNPDRNQVITLNGTTYTYDFLVVAGGIEINWGAIKGLKEALGTKSVCSNYSFKHVDYTWETIRNFKEGTALFTHPNSPVKCGGAPQKIMHLAEDYFNRVNARGNINIIFGSANPAIFDVLKYREALEKVIERKNIDARFRQNLIEIKADEKKAIFENLDTGALEEIKYDMIHVTPYMCSPEFIRTSALADGCGWVNVDKFTLQHKKYSNVFGIGDNANLPTSKTGAAIRKQAPVVAQNLIALMRQQPMTQMYNGYSSCPIVTGYNKLILAEFDYNKEPVESMPFNQAVERSSMYFMKKDLLPVMYWDGMLKGTM